MSNFRDLWYDWLGLNTWLFKQVNSIGGIPVYDALMKGITKLGDEKLLPFYLVGIAAFAVILFIVRSVTNKGGNKHYILVWINIFTIMGSGLVSSYYLADYIKRTAYFPRPYVALADDVKTGVVKVLEPQPAERAYQSFPSMHVMLVSILVISIWPLLNEHLRWGAIWLVFAIAWSRMAVGVHYPMDVLSGFFIALITMLIIRTIVGTIMRLILRVLYRD